MRNLLLLKENFSSTNWLSRNIRDLLAPSTKVSQHLGALEDFCGHLGRSFQRVRSRRASMLDKRNNHYSGMVRCQGRLWLRQQQQQQSEMDQRKSGAQTILGLKISVHDLKIPYSIAVLIQRSVVHRSYSRNEIAKGHP